MPKQVWEEVTSMEVPHNRLITTPLLKPGASLQVSKRKVSYRRTRLSHTYGTVAMPRNESIETSQ